MLSTFLPKMASTHAHLAAQVGNVALLLSLVWVGLPWPASAQTYTPPPGVGLPGRREGGGTRSMCGDLENLPEPTLTALVPQNSTGYTLEANPTFYWYVPAIGAEAAEFRLFDQNQEEVYQVMLSVEDEAGLVSVTLPANADNLELKLDQPYLWTFALICDQNDRSGDLFTEGWVQRIALDPESALARRLPRVPTIRHAALYAEAGIWFDALDSLAQERMTQPEDRYVQNQWMSLLDSVELGHLADFPFLGPLSPAESSESTEITPPSSEHHP